MNQIELNEVIRLHKLWLDDDPAGKPATLWEADLCRTNLKGAALRKADIRFTDLRAANLTQTDFRYADLRFTDFRNATGFRINLESADLECADLRAVDFRDANLRRALLHDAKLQDAWLWRADLTGADLQFTDLRKTGLTNANLQGVNLRGTEGNDHEIKSIRTDIYPVAYTSDRLQIDWDNHPIEKWWGFDDQTIAAMGIALEWWGRWKPILQQMITASPATKHAGHTEAEKSGAEPGLLEALRTALAGLRMARAHVTPAMLPDIYQHLEQDIAVVRATIRRATLTERNQDEQP